MDLSSDVFGDVNFTKPTLPVSQGYANRSGDRLGDFRGVGGRTARVVGTAPFVADPTSGRTVNSFVSGSLAGCCCLTDGHGRSSIPRTEETTATSIEERFPSPALLLRGNRRDCGRSSPDEDGGEVGLTFQAAIHFWLAGRSAALR